MIRFVGYLTLFLSLSVQALVPVEGIILGEAREELQSDPLKVIFSDIYDMSNVQEAQKVKYFEMTYGAGHGLHESCGYLGVPGYSSPFQEKQARRSMVATLQYIGLDTTIKAIGAYAKKLDIDAEGYKKLTNNLVNNYCSKNITIFSLRTIRNSFEHYYNQPIQNSIPSIEKSPYATQLVKDSTEKLSARSREFDLVIKNFRAFCSWGGEVDDYRMLTPYLNNRFIMSILIRNMIAVQIKIDPKTLKAQTEGSRDTVQVSCDNLICRKDNYMSFSAKFPRSIGSTGLFTDLSKQYCHHFRYQDPPSKSDLPLVREWLKAQELEDPIFETSQFISLMTGVPDLFNGVESYVDVPLLARSSIDERWNKWASTVLGTFSKDLLYEESLKVKVEPRRDLASLATSGFEVDFSITLGEMDRLLKSNDKIGLSFDLKLSKNYLRSIRTKWKLLEEEVDVEGQKAFKEEIARYIDLQLREKAKLFRQKMWNEDFAKLIADELVQQTKIYRGSLFESYKDEVLKVPVRFTYGLFALSYLRYRADVAAGRLKLSL